MRIIKSSPALSGAAAAVRRQRTLLMLLLLVAVCSSGLSLAANLRGQHQQRHQNTNYQPQLQHQRQPQLDEDQDEQSSVSSPSAAASGGRAPEDSVGTSEMGAVDPEFNDLTGDSSDTLDERAASEGDSDADADDAPNSSPIGTDASIGGGSSAPANGRQFGYQSSALQAESSRPLEATNLEADGELGIADSNIANAKIRVSSSDMAAAAGHHHHHKHYPHGWLKMGAHTGKKGSFGWHDKHPVGGKGRR